MNISLYQDVIGRRRHQRIMVAEQMDAPTPTPVYAPIILHPMRYDKLVCNIPTTTFLSTLGDNPHGTLQAKLSTAYPGVAISQHGTILTKTIYTQHGCHLLTIQPSNNDQTLSIVMYGDNTWDVSRCVLDMLGDLIITRQDIAIDYTGKHAWDLVVYKLSILAHQKAQAVQAATDQVECRLANMTSVHKPRTRQVALNSRTRLIAYEKGKKTMDDMLLAGGDVSMLADIDPHWSRIELQSRSIEKPLSKLHVLPLITWMDTRGDQNLLDRLFNAEYAMALHGYTTVINLAERWRDMIGEHWGDDDSKPDKVSIQMASKADQRELQAVHATLHALKASTLA